MRSNLLLLILSSVTALNAQVIQNDFDENTGINSYSMLSSNNWCDVSFALGIAENAGTQFLASANGNATGTFANQGITKTLGGFIQDHPYRVSFYIAVYNDGSLPLEAIEYADFSTLKLGGVGGTMVWDTVPTPTVYGQWVRWSGLYTPDITDINDPFVFQAVWDLDGYHSIAIDGPFMMHHPSLGIEEVLVFDTPKKVKLILDVMGRETNATPNKTLIYVYEDGTTERVFNIQ